MMKSKLLPILLGFLMSSFMISCKDEANEPDDNVATPTTTTSTSSTQDLIERKITIYVLGEDIQATSPYIRAISECEGWLMMDIAHDGLTNDQSRSFVLLSQTQQLGYYIYATPSLVLLSQFTDDIDEDLKHGKVMLMSVEGEYIRYAVVDSLLEHPTIVSQTMIKPIEETPSNARRRGYEESLGASIYRTMSRCFRSGSEEISDKFGWLSWLPVGRDAGSVASIWSSSIFAISLNQITDYNPDIAEEAYDEVVENNMFFLKQTIISSRRRAGMASAAFNLITKHSVIGKLWNDNNKVEETVSNGESDYTYPMFSTSRTMDNHYNTSVQVVVSQSQDYAITLSYDNVTENSATFHICIQDLVGTMGFISSMKLRIESFSGETQKIDFYDFSPTITVSNLKPVTGYLARVEMYAKGTECNSSLVTFVTKGQLELSPNELKFPLTGGTKEVKLKDIHEDILKSVTVTAPSWCEIVQSNTSFSVKTAASTGKRTGTITVSVVLIDDTNLSSSVEVTQEEIKLGWDNTRWKISGNVTTSGFGESGTSSGEFYLTVNSVANNDFSWISGTVDIADNISVNEAGQLCVTGSLNTAHWSMTLTRTSETTATCNFSGDDGLGYVSQHGTLSGLLIE